MTEKKRRVNEPRYKEGMFTRVCRPCRRVDPKIFCQECGQETDPTIIFNSMQPPGR